mmetsp:Transcript_130643/g.418930  ORF Transcript_130643/g.418930 Transcript_130643/m.418930 type:complete len:593 (+) Transcript_130643:63-1841(+)
MGQCSAKSVLEYVDVFDFVDAGSKPRVSLEKARSHSSNAAVTSARYHNANGGRRLTDDYEVDATHVLGSGLCGDVVLARGKIDRRRYALKTIRKQQFHGSQMEQLLAEVEIYLTLDHPNIARLHDVYETDNQIGLITECCEGGELYYRLQEKVVFSDAEAAGATRQMLRAVGYLHAHNVVHRDLKLENFLYDALVDAEEPSGAQLKLIDFGFAKLWDASTPMTASCGSVAYVSPDVLSGQGYTNKCDLWSIGIVVWMLLVGYPPFHGSESAMLTKIKACQLDWSHKSRWKVVRDEAIDFLKGLLKVDPEQRPNAVEALRHRWFLQPGPAEAKPVLLGRDVLHSIECYARASKVRRAALQLLVQELEPEETRDLRDLFIAMDKSSKGTISFEDLKNAVRGTRVSQRRPPRAGFGDGGGGGGGSPGAALVRAISTPCSPMRSATLLHDTGSSSPVSRCDSGLSDAGSPTSPTSQTLRRYPSESLDKLAAVLDSNGNERIYYSDFLAATIQVRARLREEPLRAVFNRFDSDRSGAITAADFRAVLGDSFEGGSVEELLAQADARGEGEVTFEDFKKVMEDLEAPALAESRGFSYL